MRPCLKITFYFFSFQKPSVKRLKYINKYFIIGFYRGKDRILETY